MRPSDTPAPNDAQAGQHVADIEKNRHEVLRIEFAPFGGQQYLNIRVWFRDQGGDLKPTHKGFALHVAKLPELADATDEACAIAESKGWVR